MGRLTINHHPLLAMVLLMLINSTNGNANIDVVNGGYEGVVVAIGKELQENMCQTYINKTKDMVNSASVLLNSATMERMFFSKVTILIPETWNCEGVTIDPATGITFEDAHIRIQESHPVFVDNPWTEQPRGCGDPGNFIYFSDTFLTDPNNALGSPGNVFVHEWAKFRWGVFEEFGHFGDPVFPSMYQNGLEWQPNYCTDGEVQGTSTCEDGSNAAECNFTPNLLQQNLTSSLLATPFVQTVVTFCNRSNHVTTALTKHNLMCGGNSTWEIISKHSDITNITVGRAMTDTVYTIQKIAPSSSQEKVVFVLDVSKLMGAKKSRWEYVRDSLEQFIMVKAAVNSQVGIVTFGNTLYNKTELQTLSSEAVRQQLVNALPTKTTNDSVKRASLGLASAAELLGKDGVIILITENLQATIDTAEELLNAANGLAVQPILYPAFSTISTDPYKPVAEFQGFSPYVVIDKSTGGNQGAQDAENLFSLSHYIQLAGSNSFVEVITGNCTVPAELTECNTTLSVGNSDNFESVFFIEALRANHQASNIDFQVLNASGNYLPIFNQVTSSIIFKGNELQNGVYTVTASTTGSILAKTKAILSAVVLLQNTTRLRIDVFASKPLDDLAYTSDSAPILYAKLSDGSRSVVNAEVTAILRSPNSNQTTKTSTLRLQDNGVGGDVTGNDGIYSSYILGITELGSIAISVSANDNNGSASFVGSSSGSRAAPVNLDGLSRACCGSRLNLDGVTLEPTGSFTATTPPGLNGNTSGDVTFNYPPSRITDLNAVRKNDIVTLSFTATGENFNIGQASFYILDHGNGFSETLNKSLPAGTAISEEVEIVCDTLYTFTITAADSSNKTSPPSNEARVFVSCEAIIGPDLVTTLSGGAIAGIVIGCLLFVIILIIIVCLCLKRKKKDESRLWKVVTCRCCKKGRNTSRHQGRSRAGKTDVIRTNPGPIRETREVYGENVNSGASAPTPIRSIEDMYGKPDMQAKWNARNRNREDSDDGGFSTQNRRQENLRMNNMNDDYARHPANKVGLPPASGLRYAASRSSDASTHDNFGYSDNESYSQPSGNTTFVNKKPIIPPRKPVTQV